MSKLNENNENNGLSGSGKMDRNNSMLGALPRSLSGMMDRNASTRYVMTIGVIVIVVRRHCLSSLSLFSSLFSTFHVIVVIGTHHNSSQIKNKIKPYGNLAVTKPEQTITLTIIPFSNVDPSFTGAWLTATSLSLTPP